VARKRKKDEPEETAVGHDVVDPGGADEDTAERAALKRSDVTEVHFSPEEPEPAAEEPAAPAPEAAERVAVEPPAAEPAAAEAAAEEPAAVEPPAAEPPAPDEAPPPQPAAAPPTGETGGISPAAADRRAAEAADGFSEHPELYVAAAFVAALVLGKLLKRLTRGKGD
jgi:hypothetical protein